MSDTTTSIEPSLKKHAHYNHETTKERTETTQHTCGDGVFRAVAEGDGLPLDRVEVHPGPVLAHLLHLLDTKQQQ